MNYGSDTAHLVVVLVVQILDQRIPVPLLTPETAHLVGLLVVQVLDQNIPVRAYSNSYAQNILLRVLMADNLGVSNFDTIILVFVQWTTL
jgi:hypothetical protein